MNSDSDGLVESRSGGDLEGEASLRHARDLVEAEAKDGSVVVLGGEEARSKDLVARVLGLGVEGEGTHTVVGGDTSEGSLNASLHLLGGEIEGQDTVGEVRNEDEVIVDGGVGETEVVGAEDGVGGGVTSSIVREDLPLVVALQADDLGRIDPVERTIDHDGSLSGAVQETVLTEEQSVGAHKELVGGSDGSQVASRLGVAQDLVALEARDVQITVRSPGQTVRAVHGSVA